MQLKSRSLTKFLTLGLMVAVWLTTVCVAMAPSHACCKPSASHLAAALPSCCTAHAVVQPSQQSAGNGLNPDLWPSATAFNASDFLSHQTNSVNASRLASAQVPDQSGRYLELRVLLN